MTVEPDLKADASAKTGAFAAIALSLLPQLLQACAQGFNDNPAALSLCRNMLASVEACLQRGEASPTACERCTAFRAADEFLGALTQSGEFDRAANVCWGLYYGVEAAIRHGIAWEEELMRAEARGA
jgi:hypothetical protein